MRYGHYSPSHFQRIRDLLDAHCQYQEGCERVEDQILFTMKELMSLCKWHGISWEDMVNLTGSAEVVCSDLPDDTVFTGKVKLFVSKDEKNFGFIDILLPKQGEVFFHKDNGITLGCDGGSLPVEVGPEKRNPKSGDRVLFQVGEGKKGPVAKWWAFTDTHEEALRQIATRPYYRMRRRDRSPILWQGQDLTSFRLMYPLKWHQSDPRWDVSLYLIERMFGDDWFECPDPR